MSLKLLWPTPVWEIETPELADIVAPLLHEIKTTPPDPESLFKIDLPEASKFVKMLKPIVNDAMKEGGYPWEYNKLLWGRAVRMTQGNWDSPHIHLAPMLVGVFYLQVQRGHGDLFLVPSSGNSGFTTHHDGMKGTRLYHQIEAKEGKLVLMPADLAHFVLPNTLPLPRYSIALNFEMNAL
jgi:hypothetical protein